MVVQLSGSIVTFELVLLDRGSRGDSTFICPTRESYQFWRDNDGEYNEELWRLLTEMENIFQLVLTLFNSFKLIRICVFSLLCNKMFKRHRVLWPLLSTWVYSLNLKFKICGVFTWDRNLKYLQINVICMMEWGVTGHKSNYSDIFFNSFTCVLYNIEFTYDTRLKRFHVSWTIRCLTTNW